MPSSAKPFDWEAKSPAGASRRVGDNIALSSLVFAVATCIIALWALSSLFSASSFSSSAFCARIAACLASSSAANFSSSAFCAKIAACLASSSAASFSSSDCSRAAFSRINSFCVASKIALAFSASRSAFAFSNFCSSAAVSAWAANSLAASSCACISLIDSMAASYSFTARLCFSCNDFISSGEKVVDLRCSTYLRAVWGSISDENIRLTDIPSPDMRICRRLLLFSSSKAKENIATATFGSVLNSSKSLLTSFKKVSWVALGSEVVQTRFICLPSNIPSPNWNFLVRRPSEFVAAGRSVLTDCPGSAATAYAPDFNFSWSSANSSFAFCNAFSFSVASKSGTS